MRIQRSTYEFLLISAILGSIVLCTALFGYGAGVLAILFWIVVLMIRLKRGSQPNKTTDADPDSET